MKKKGNTCDYIAHRNSQLIAAFKKCIREAALIDLDVIYRKVSRMPCSRFWVSESRAFIVIRQHLLSGEWNVKSRERLEMFKEIERRALEIVNSSDCEDLEDAVYEAVNSPAPCFYLTPRTCRTLIYSLLSKA